MNVEDGMSEVILAIGPAHTLREAARMMAARKVGAAVVVDRDHDGVGILTERDILMSVAAGQSPDEEVADQHCTQDLVFAGRQWIKFSDQDFRVGACDAEDEEGASIPQDRGTDGRIELLDVLVGQAKMRGEFPRLRTEGYSITSPESDDYNCFAWAGSDSIKRWDPEPASGHYWPDSVPRTLDIESFVKLYALKGGYAICDSDALEMGFEKIALFVSLSKEVTHAARQLPSGAWTSKLGDWEDIEHKSLSGLESGLYGRVAVILKRAQSL